MPTKSTEPNSNSLSDEDKEQARSEIDIAISLLGLAPSGRHAAGMFHCPNGAGHDSGKPKARAYTDGGYCCHKCKSLGVEHATGNAVDLLMNWGGYSYLDAMAALLGRPVREKQRVPVAKQVVTVAAHAHTVELNADVLDIYAAIVAAGSVDASISFYGRFGISADAVIESGSTRIMHSASFEKKLLDDFGRDALVAAGVIKENAGKNRDKDYWLVNRDYPVVEPHLIDDGRVVGLQFRGSEKTEERIRDTKVAKAAGKTRKDGTPLNIPPKFLSIAGAGPASRVGLGIPALAAHTERTRAALAAAGSNPDGPPAEGNEVSAVWIVEGFKDVLAMRTMGFVAYGTPGAGILPVRKVCDLLRPHVVKVALDGDDAGEAGRLRLAEHFTAHGIRWVDKPPPDGKDMCDILEDRVAARTEVAKSA